MAKQIKWIAVAGILLVLGYLFVFLKQVDAGLIYYWQQSVPVGLGESLREPGGFVVMLAGRLMEGLASPIVAWLIFSLLLGLSLLSFRIIFQSLNSGPLCLVLVFATLIPLFSLMAHYDLPFELLVAVGMALVLSMVQGLWEPEKAPLRYAYHGAVSVVLYVLCGSLGLLILAQVWIVRSLLSRKYTGLQSLIIPAFLPLLQVLLDKSLTIKSAYLASFQFSPYMDVPIIFFPWVFSPLLALLVVWISRLAGISVAGKGRFWFSIGGMALVLAALVFVSRSHLKPKERDIYRMVEMAFDQDWDGLLHTSQAQAQINRLVQFETNRALFHKGLLLEQMFHFPQQFGTRGLFLDDSNNGHLAVHLASFYTDMAYAMEARHWATEALMVHERRPNVLKPLVMAYLAMGNTRMARKYLDILSNSRLHRDWYERVLSHLEEGKTGELEEVIRFRKNNPRMDFFASTGNPTYKMRAFYTNNPKNRMAFEYMLAAYLLQHRVGDALKYIKGFRSLGYEELPRCMEEALLIYFARQPGTLPPSFGYEIDRQTVQDFRDFSKKVASAGDRHSQMQAAAEYRHSYWFYILFSSPYVQK